MKRIIPFLIYAFITVVLFIFVFPYIWMILTSFKTRLDIFTLPPKFIFKPYFKHYIDVFSKGEFLKNSLNSAIIAILSTIVSVVVGTPAAYSLARFKLMGEKHLSMWILSIRMMPPIVAVIPFFLIASKLQLIDTHFLLILVYMTFNLPFVIWILRSFFEEVPFELEQAAILDGYSRWSIFTKIALPLVKPGLVSVTILCLIFSWNEFLFANVLTKEVAKTLPPAISVLITTRTVQWGRVGALAAMVVLPILIFTYLIQRYMVRGLTLGAVKG
jgi:multiple sugar transport system permease protein